MVKVRVMVGKDEYEERDIELPSAVKEIEGVDLEEVAKLIEYAKSKGWI